jgi:hypothetical protein
VLEHPLVGGKLSAPGRHLVRKDGRRPGSQRQEEPICNRGPDFSQEDFVDILILWIEAMSRLTFPGSGWTPSKVRRTAGPTGIEGRSTRNQGPFGDAGLGQAADAPLKGAAGWLYPRILVAGALAAIALAAIPLAPLALPGQTPPVPAQAAPSAPPAPSQQAPASVREAPGAIYKDAMHPLEVVRASLGNWSQAELGALAVGMRRAREACDAVKPDDYQGEDLYDLAHLCAFGQDWSPANDAALKYLASREEPHRTQAYAISVSALAHINAMDLALATTREMLRRQPYDAEVAYTVRYMKDTLEHAGNPQALALAGEEHPLIVQALSQSSPLKAMHGDTTISTGALYASAMELPFLDRFAGNTEVASAAAAELDAALQKLTVIPAEDQQEIDQLRTQYQLLGTHLPHLQLLRSLQSAGARPQIGPGFGEATVLVLFSDWCIECRELVKTMTRFATVNSDAPILAYALLYSEDSTPGAQDTGKLLHAENEKQLAGTPTFEVPAQTALTFGVVDYPLGVVLDGSGTIRFIGVLPSDAFNGDGYIAKVLERMFPTSVSKQN